ncbi:hypothetical protein AURDEDRAFT_159761 [Auricularia subglabra TFB-10046 SS5]|nr:hypothetical protein AURDEDRAFT_159761 [Auricularia subglabra TFB-10046 SS5]
MSIWEDLPMELVLHILDKAARDSIQTNRIWVVNIALVSSFAYALVHPVLYHTMVIDERNRPLIEDLIEDEMHHHIFRSVRRVLVTRQLPWNTLDYVPLLSSVQQIDAPMSFVARLAESPAFRPRKLAVRYRRLVDVINYLPAATLLSVTHLFGYFPDGDYQITSETLAPVLAAMPALSHIAYDNVNMDDDEPGVLPLTNLAELEDAIGAALQCRRIQCVAVRVAGRCMDEWDDIFELLCTIKDPRVCAWPDRRHITTWSREEFYAAADTWAGRDVWTESKPIR